MIQLADHAPIAALQARQGELILGGQKVSELAERVGQTPFYAYDSAVIADRIARLRAIMPAQAKLHYALKANPFAPLLAWMRQHVDGVDCASAGELELALQAGFDARQIGFAGPGKTNADLAYAWRERVTVTIESPRQLTELARLAASNSGLAVAIRVNPSHQLRATGMQMGGGSSAFGVDEEAVPALIAQARALGIDVVGLHFFAGSQSLSAEQLAQAIRANASAAREIMHGGGQAWRWLNLGGGFGVPYAAGETELELRAGGAISSALHDAARAVAPLELRLELGRYLVADAGVYVCRVIDRKVSRGRLYCIVDGGLHHNLAATGNFGQVIKRAYPVAIANRIVDPDRPDDALPVERADVVGPLCTPLDCFGRNVALSRFEVGDLLAVFRSGAYGLSASPNRFLGHPNCAEVLLA